ncbi:FAD dependent oxidoreductase-domain-containing protein [Aspergillus insuetus]
MADPDGTRRIGIKQRLIANVRRGARIPTVDHRQPWLPNPGHRLHDTQSATLPEKVEYVIIGSGIAGCSVAWNLLTQDGFEHTVAILEARGLASGATGRSGGQVRLMAVHEFADMSARRGILSAFAFNRFAAESYYRLVELVREDPSAADYHFAPVNAVTNLVDRADTVRVNHHVGAFEDACALRLSPGELRPPEYSSSHYRFLNTRGATEQPGLVVLPYRLVTGLFERLLQMYPTQLSIQTHTPVHHVGYNRCLASHKYTLTTSRGRVRANHVIHCTNGWTSSLLPELAEKIFPWRTTMAYHEFDYDPNLCRDTWGHRSIYGRKSRGHATITPPTRS